jgi:hypothetical protein
MPNKYKGLRARSPPKRKRLFMQWPCVNSPFLPFFV